MLVQADLSRLQEGQLLPGNLYTETGKLLAKQGERVTKTSLTQWKRLSNLKQDSKVVELKHEGTRYKVPFEASFNEPEHTKPESSIIQTESSALALKALKGFWKSLEKGQQADLALLHVVRDHLISDLIDRHDSLRYLNQLRVRDGVTYDHTLDVASLSVALGIRLGYDKVSLKEIGLAALLHDLGKLLIPRQIMFKPGRLSEDEFRVMKLHPELGYKILRDEMKLPEAICLPALQHQEMYGGGGYPYNLRGDEIHPYSHIVKIADVYDALTSRRPYKEPIPSNKAIDILMAEGSRGFHPQILHTFAAMANYSGQAQATSPVAVRATG